MKRRMKKYMNFTSILLVVCGLYLIFTFILVFFVDDWRNSGSFGDSFGALNGLFSGIALAGVIYTLYLQTQTFELQRKDFALSIQPLLSLEPIEETRTSYKLNVSNIGNGTALNIDLIPTEARVDLPVIFKADKRIMSLKPGETKVIEIISYDEKNEIYQSLMIAHLIPKYSNQAVNITIKYNDIEGKEMKQVFELGKGDLKVPMAEYM